MKGVQEQKSIMWVKGRQKNLSFAIKVWHHKTSLVMPDNDPRMDFSLPLISMTDPYIIWVFLEFSGMNCMCSYGLTLQLLFILSGC